jgi:hypothetical protein
MSIGSAARSAGLRRVLLLRGWQLAAIAGAVLACAAAATEPDHAARPAADAVRQLHELERRWVKAEIHRDAATLREILDDGFIATFGAGKPRDKEGFIDAVVGNASDTMLSQDLTDETIRVDRDTAVIVETDTVRGIDDGKAYTSVLRITTTYIKRHGRWAAFAEHIATAPPPK